MHCASCGTPFPDSALFCPGCGQRLAGQRRVPMPAPAASVPQPARPAARRRPEPLVPREELEASIAARQELGERMEPEVVQAFLDRVEQALDARIDAHVHQRLRGNAGGPAGVSGDGGSLAVAICSLIFGIPLTAIAGGIAGPVGMAGVWTMIVLVNASYHQRRKD